MLTSQTYQKYVTIERGQNVLYITVQKALYGMLKSALLFYRKLSGYLELAWFVINLSDPCVANKMLNSDDHHLACQWFKDFTQRWMVNEKIYGWKNM